MIICRIKNNKHGYGRQYRLKVSFIVLLTKSFKDVVASSLIVPEFETNVNTVHAATSFEDLTKVGYV